MLSIWSHFYHRCRRRCSYLAVQMAKKAGYGSSYSAVARDTHIRKLLPVKMFCINTPGGKTGLALLPFIILSSDSGNVKGPYYCEIVVSRKNKSIWEKIFCNPNRALLADRAGSRSFAARRIFFQIAISRLLSGLLRIQLEL